jgi:hypothetical protein
MNRAFGNVYEDTERARAYATLQFPATYYLAFRDLPALIRRYNHGRRALDFGCGTFPENRHARDGDRVRIVMLDVPDRRPVEDVICTDAHYRRLFESAGLEVLDVQSPLATGKEATRWVSETSTAPWTIYVLLRLSAMISQYLHTWRILPRAL